MYCGIYIETQCFEPSNLILLKSLQDWNWDLKTCMNVFSLPLLKTWRKSVVLSAEICKKRNENRSWQSSGATMCSTRGTETLDRTVVTTYRPALYGYHPSYSSPYMCEAVGCFLFSFLCSMCSFTYCTHGEPTALQVGVFWGGEKPSPGHIYQNHKFINCSSAAGITLIQVWHRQVLLFSARTPPFIKYLLVLGRPVGFLLPRSPSCVFQHPL